MWSDYFDREGGEIIPTIRETYLLMERIKRDRDTLIEKIEEIEENDWDCDLQEEHDSLVNVFQETQSQYRSLEAYMAILN